MDTYEAYKFLSECGAFMVLTVNESRPCGRPFGAIMEDNGKLYISTSPRKAVYHQILTHGEIQILALKPATRKWIRIDGTASVCGDLTLKEKMQDACPVLKKHYSDPEDENYALIEIDNLMIDYHIM